MSKRRVTFSKTGMGKYISHLDLLRCFTRAIQRSGLPVVYSQGFNPHQKMTFSLPLPIGVTSQCETVDIQFEDNVSDKEIFEKLSENLPMDIKVLNVEEPVFKASDIVSASYIMKAFTDGTVDKNEIINFFNEPEIAVMKKTKKKGEKAVNLQDYIRSWEISEVTEKDFSLNVTVDAGGERNLKPELLSSAIGNYLKSVIIDDWDIHRTQIFRKTEDDIMEIFS